MHPWRIGIVSREFFDPSLGRLGGFGAATRAVTRVLGSCPGVEPVLLAGAAQGPGGRRDSVVGGAPLLFGTGNALADLRRWRGLDLDALLTIDWHSSFLPLTRALPRTPLLVWSRDPRSSAEWETIAALRLPGGQGDTSAVVGPACTGGNSDLEPPGAATDQGLALLGRRSRRWRRPVRVVVTDESLIPRFVARYGRTPRPERALGTPVDVELSAPVPVDTLPELPEGVRAGRPLLVFLGRLDPIKRPWVFEALAAELSDVELVALGQVHLNRGWAPSPRPNLHWLGHVGGVARASLLAGAVATINTSIHEAIPLSLLESLHLGTPVVATVDPGRLAHRFGVSVPPASGDGLEAVPLLVGAVNSLLADPVRSAALGEAGQRWVRVRHAREPFLAGLARLLREVGRPGLASRLDMVGGSLQPGGEVAADETGQHADVGLVPPRQVSASSGIKGEPPTVDRQNP